MLHSLAPTVLDASEVTSVHIPHLVVYNSPKQLPLTASGCHRALPLRLIDVKIRDDLIAANSYIGCQWRIYGRVGGLLGQRALSKSSVAEILLPLR